MKPRVFIGSSKESVTVAHALAENLFREAEVTPWTHCCFKLTTPALDSLLAVLDDFDFGVFVFAPDDIAKIRGMNVKVARDNVIFELGLFCGRLGKDSSFMVLPEGVDLHLPTDLLGVKPATYSKRSDDNLRAALLPASAEILRTMKKSGRYEVFSKRLKEEETSKEWSDAFVNVADARQTAIKGKWAGKIVPHKIDTTNVSKLLKEIPITFEFYPEGRMIRATSVFEMDVDRGPVHDEYVGGFFGDSTFRLEYRKKNAKTFGFGSIVFELSADALTLHGFAVGYASHFNAKMYHSEIILNKVKKPNQGKKLVAKASRL